MLGAVLLNASVRAAELNIVTENFPNFQYLNEQGQLQGKAAELVLKVLEASKIDHQISVMNWSLAYNAALRDDNTCLFSIARLDTRESQFTWVFPVAVFSASFYALESANITLSRLDDALQYKTAVIRNNFSHQYLLERGFDEERHLILITNFDNVFDLLATRSDLLDLVILSDAQYEYRLAKGEIKVPLQRLWTLEAGRTELYFACNKNIAKPLFNRLLQAYQQVSNTVKPL
ncbi:amino acid ABC transporter substrate-binding protein [Pseudoalteromonas fenneropenaei]|uniref:Amino acid ABC transporter substrate-binding protein n=1 Tax=Pseudoalteromonas fenneropenaei TaxID=1737459 RepID=A0ABV7CQI8_9GAMM